MRTRSETARPWAPAMLRMAPSTSSAVMEILALSAACPSSSSSIIFSSSSLKICDSAAACCGPAGIFLAISTRKGLARVRSSERRMGRSPMTATTRSTTAARAGAPRRRGRPRRGQWQAHGEAGDGGLGAWCGASITPIAACPCGSRRSRWGQTPMWQGVRGDAPRTGSTPRPASRSADRAPP